MRFPPPADLPEGGTPAERLDMAFRKVLTVPKEALLREEAKERHRKDKDARAANLADPYRP